MSEQGLRAVIGNFVQHMQEFNFPPRDAGVYAVWIDMWGDKFMKATGFFRLQEENARLRKEMAHEGCNALDFCTCDQ